MNDLLAIALESHGGLHRWNQITRVETDLSITGAIWHFKGQPDILKRVTFSASTEEQSVSLTPFIAPSLAAVFEEGNVRVEDRKGRVVDIRENAGAGFIGHKIESQWDLFHVAYFASYSIWGYLMAPFLYTYPGFITEELSPWEEGGEQWRRLKITFPNYLACHCRDQISYYGPDGLLRRHDYNPEVLGKAAGANYASDYQNFDGIKVPTKRRVYAHDAVGHRSAEPLLVAIDVQQLRFS